MSDFWCVNVWNIHTLSVQSIKLSYTDLREAPADVTGEALATIKHIDLCHAKLTDEHWTSVFTEIKFSNPVIVEDIDIEELD